MVPMVPMVSSGNACEVIDVNSIKASRKLPREPFLHELSCDQKHIYAFWMLCLAGSRLTPHMDSA